MDEERLYENTIDGPLYMENNDSWHEVFAVIDFRSNMQIFEKYNKKIRASKKNKGSLILDVRLDSILKHFRKHICACFMI